MLAPFEGDSPSGVELRNDGRFHAIERLLDAAGKSTRLTEDGSINGAAPAVAWDDVMQQGIGLAAEGRDLRLLVILARAAYALEGFDGLGQGFELLGRTVTDYWDSLYPGLRDRPDPAVSAMPRFNALRQLENDDNGLLGDLRFGYVLTPRGIGPITGDDLASASLTEFEMLNRAASGLGQSEKAALAARHADRVNRVRAATRALASEDTQRAEVLITAIGTCERGLSGLCRAFDRNAGLVEGQGLVLSELAEFFEQCRVALEAGHSAVAQKDARSEEPSDVAVAQSIKTNPDLPPEAPTQGGELRSRTDVEAALDRIVAFYERTEPSSPIPHLARRMRRMVSMDFLELMEEVAPSGLKEFRNIAGVEEGKKK